MAHWSSLMTRIDDGQVLGFWGHKWHPNVEVSHDFNNDFGGPRGCFAWAPHAAVVTVTIPFEGGR